MYGLEHELKLAPSIRHSKDWVSEDSKVNAGVRLVVDPRGRR